jgi:isoleucyl-tRNA synthetase
VTLGLSSGQVTLRPEDVDLVQQTRTGWGVASDGPLTVALDLELDEELRREGAVRELIHHVQTLRKSSGLEVTDRIVLDIAGDPDLIAAIEEHRERLATETLAVDVRAEPVGPLQGTVGFEIDGMRASLSLRRA